MDPVDPLTMAVAGEHRRDTVHRASQGFRTLAGQK